MVALNTTSSLGLSVLLQLCRGAVWRGGVRRHDVVGDAEDLGSGDCKQ